MKNSTHSSLAGALVALGVAACLSGCATPSARSARDLSGGAPLNLTKYQTVTVVPFDVAGSRATPLVGKKFAGDIAVMLQNDFPGRYRLVRLGQPYGRPDELIIRGRITKYQPGDPAARFMLAGLGAALFKADVEFADGSTRRVLFQRPLSEFWAWGGYLGASKDIDGMMHECAAAIAKTAAVGKGAKP